MNPHTHVKQMGDTRCCIIHSSNISKASFEVFSSVRTVFDQCIKGELDGNPGVKDDNLPACSQDTETIVCIEKGTDRLSSGFSHDFRFVC